ncbi:MAG: WecB/TagA/CpsF family glycosyltransferase [Chloroflexota bacterium]
MPSLTLNRILAVELADIGDLILTTPALFALRETFPSAQIDMLTTAHAAPILDGTGLVDQVILFNKFAFDRPTDLLRPANLGEALTLAQKLRSGHYDAVLIFHHLTTRFGAWKYAALAMATGAPIRAGLDNGRGWFLTHRTTDYGFGKYHQVKYWLNVVRLLGVQVRDVRLHIGISEADRAWASEHLPDRNKPFVAIHPGSGGYSTARRWEPEKFAAVADAIHDSATIVLVGGPDDGANEVINHMHYTEEYPAVNLVGKTTLGQLAAVLERCDLYIGADSGVMHLAAAAGKSDLYALYGPSNAKAWGPWHVENSIVRSGVRCSPCSYVGHTIGLRHGCEARTCMKLITPRDIPGIVNWKPFGARLASVMKPSRQIRKPTLRVLGIPVDNPTFGSMIDQIGEWISGNSPRQICTVNPEFIMTAQKDINFYNILNRCDLCMPDGVGLLWAARRLGHPLPERVTGSDGVPLIAERAAREGWRLFLLGAAPGVAEKTAQILTERYPSLQIVGTYAGSPSAQEEDEIAAKVAASHADILFVAYGAPNQDKWIARNLPRLNVKVAMGIGGAFDFIAGTTQRAPIWMRRAGLEWLHRLIQQPWRAKRMLRLPLFVLAVLWRGSRGPLVFVGPNNTGTFS